MLTFESIEYKLQTILNKLMKVETLKDVIIYRILVLDKNSDYTVQSLNDYSNDGLIMLLEKLTRTDELYAVRNQLLQAKMRTP